MAVNMARDRVPQATLSSEINTATRTLHTELNKLITARLPFALPPLAADPHPYTAGLVHFAHIFLTFESLWTDLLPDAPGAATSPLLSFLLVNPYAEPELFTSPPAPQTLAFLQDLRPKGLARSGRIKRDLQYLSGLAPTDFDVMLAQYPGDKVAEFCAHIRKSVRHKPHVLVAYAWCFYMAVFSGGRWIRGELVKAGPDFWSSGADAGPHDAGSLADNGLSLWSFPGTHDGEDIKEAFKERLLGAEALFTPDERVDIIEEAKTIFKLCAGLVTELDAMLGTDLEQVKRGKVASPHHGHLTHGKTDKNETVTPKESHRAVRTWLQRPEVTGAAVALGCLACAVVLRLSY